MSEFVPISYTEYCNIWFGEDGLYHGHIGGVSVEGAIAIEVDEDGIHLAYPDEA